MNRCPNCWSRDTDTANKCNVCGHQIINFSFQNVSTASGGIAMGIKRMENDS